eukprot:2002092-Rhodomonas_salina.1
MVRNHSLRQPDWPGSRSICLRVRVRPSRRRVGSTQRQRAALNPCPLTLNAARADDTDWKANRPVQVTAVAREHAHALHTHSEQTRACTAGWPRAGARGRSKCGVRVQQRTSVSDVAGAVQLGPGDDGR